MIFFFIGLRCLQACITLTSRHTAISKASGRSSHWVHLMKDEPVIECTMGLEPCNCSWIVETVCCFLLLLDIDCDGLRAESYGFIFPHCFCNMLYWNIWCLCAFEQGLVFLCVISLSDVRAVCCYGQLHMSHMTHIVHKVHQCDLIPCRLSWYREKLLCRCSISPLRANSTRVTSPIMARNCMWVQTVEMHNILVTAVRINHVKKIVCIPPLDVVLAMV